METLDQRHYGRGSVVGQEHSGLSRVEDCPYVLEALGWLQTLFLVIYSDAQGLEQVDGHGKVVMKKIRGRRYKEPVIYGLEH